MPTAVFIPPPDAVEELHPSRKGSFVPSPDQADEITPDSALGSFARGAAAKTPSGLGGFGGALAGAELGAEVGALGGPFAEFTVPAGAILGGIGGAMGGSAIGEKIKNWWKGPEALALEQAQLEANRAEHGFATGAGEMLPALLPAAAGGGGIKNLVTAGAKTADEAAALWKAAPLAKRAAANFGEAALAGEKMAGARVAAHQADTGEFDPKALALEPLEEAVKFGPVGFIPHAQGILGSIAKGIPDAAVMTLSSNLYDHFAKGKPLSLEGYTTETGEAIPSFLLLNAITSVLTHGKGMAPKTGTENAKAPPAETAWVPTPEQAEPIEQAAPEPVATPVAPSTPEAAVIEPVAQANAQVGNTKTAEALAQLQETLGEQKAEVVPQAENALTENPDFSPEQPVAPETPTDVEKNVPWNIAAEPENAPVSEPGPPSPEHPASTPETATEPIQPEAPSPEPLETQRSGALAEPVAESTQPANEGEPHALPEQSPSSLLQHPQEGAGEGGSERERVEPVEQGPVPPVESGQNAPAVEGDARSENIARAREIATRPNAPDSTSAARPLTDELGGAAADYTAFTNQNMQRRASAIVDAIGSVDEMVRLLSSEDGVRQLGLSADLGEYVAAETLKRANAAVTSAKNDVDRILAKKALRQVRALWDVTGTGAGQHLVSRKLAGATLRAEMPVVTVDKAIEKQQETTIDKELPVEPVKEAVKAAAAVADDAANQELASKIDADTAPQRVASAAQQAESIKVLQAQVDAYFDGETPARVKVVYEPASESEASLEDGVLKVNAAALREPSTADVARLLEHEIGHGIFSDPAMRKNFDALWNSLDKGQRAEIENYVAERYSATERNEEASVRALDAIRDATRDKNSKDLWQRFVEAVTRLWERFTGKMPSDPAQLAARMVEIGVERLKMGKAGRGLAMSRRSDLLKTDSPSLARLLNMLRGKIAPGMKWRDIFTSLKADQRAWEHEIFDRIKKHEALKGLHEGEMVQLTRELSKAWQRERQKVFNKELDKQLKKVSGVKPEAVAKVKAAAPRLQQLINLGALDAPAFRDAIAKEWGIGPTDGPEAMRLKEIGVKAQEAPEGVPRRKLEQKFIEGLQDLTKLSKLEILENWWTASVLSGWRTHMDILLAAANGIEDVGLGSIVTAIRTGRPDVAYRAIGKTLANLPTALQEALHHITTGDRSMMRNYDAEIHAAKEDGHKLMSNAGRELMKKGGFAKAPGAFMEIIGRMLTAWDHVNATSTFEGAKLMALANHPELYEQALKIGPEQRAEARLKARSELTNGAEPKTNTERLQENARVKELLDAKLPTEVIEQASEIGRDAALQGDPTGLGWAVWYLAGQLGKIPGMGADAIEKSGADNASARLVMAALRRASTVSKIITGSKFARAASHAINRQVSYVPGIGLLRKAEGSMHAPRTDILFAKQLFGTAVGLSLLAAFRHKKDDKEGIEGSWKGLTPQQRSSLYSQGKSPNSVWYRDSHGRVVSFNFNQWGIAGILGTIGAMEDERRYKGNNSDLSILTNGIVSGSMQFTQKAQLQGLQQILGDSPYSTSGNAADSLAKRLNRYAATNVGGLVPRVAKDVDALIKPQLHDSHEWWAQWAAQLPVARELSTGVRTDIFGKNIEIDRGPLSRVVQTGTADPTYRLLGRLNERDLWLPDPTSGVRVVKLPSGNRRSMTAREQDVFQRLAGAGYKEFIAKHGAEILAMSDHKAAQSFISKQTKVIRDHAAEKAAGK